MDVAAGGSIGLLLGMLVGLSATPIVQTVVSALVALLAGIFGLSDKLSSTMGSGASRRLIGFSIAAVIALPVAILMRTHDVLAPSIERQRQSLRMIGIPDGAEQDRMLGFLRFGLPVGDKTPTTKESEKLSLARQGVLYTTPAGWCDELERLRLQGAPAADFLTLFATGSDNVRKLGKIVSALPPDRQKTALDAAPIYFCTR